MKNEFDDFNEFDEEDDISDDFSFQDNYYYDEDSSFDSTVNNYEYLDYEYNKIDRNAEDDYYNEEIDDEYNSNNETSNNRNKLIKIILIFIILLLIIWIISLGIKFTNKKVEKSDEVKIIKTSNVDYETMFLKTKNAALKYYTEEEITDSIDCEKTLKLLKLLEYIDIDSDNFNLEQSYIKLMKAEDTDNFNILIMLVHEDEQKTKKYEVSNYSYCIDTYLCEKQDILGLEENQEEITEIFPNEQETSIQKETKLSSWSLWSDYERTSCDTKAISCDENDINCLTEVKLYERKEKIGTYNKLYSNSRHSFSLISKENTTICNNYDYIKIDGIYYKTEKNSYYQVLGAITKNIQSNYYNWRYDGRNSYEKPPTDTITTRYVYVGPDYSNCSNTCPNYPKYYYDKYTFTKSLTTSATPSTDCSNVTSKVIANYSITKQNINVTRVENLYGTVCYKSNRTRKMIEK